MQQLKPIPQPQPKNLHPQNKDWYLTNPEGSLAARIQDGLSIGENSDGELQFNPSEPDKIFYFELDVDTDDDSSLCLRAASPRYGFRRYRGDVEDHLTIAPWQSVTLRMPGGVLAIYPELAGRRASREMLKVELVGQPERQQKKPAHSAAAQKATEKPVPVQKPPKPQPTPLTVSEPAIPVVETRLQTEPRSPKKRIREVSKPVVPVSADRAFPEPEPARSTPSSEFWGHTDKPAPEQEPEPQPRPYRASVALLIANLLALSVVSWWTMPSFWSAAMSGVTRIDAVQFIAQSSRESFAMPAAVAAVQEETPAELLNSIEALSADIDSQDSASIDFMMQTLKTVTASNPSNQEAEAMLSDLEEKFADGGNRPDTGITYSSSYDPALTTGTVADMGNSTLVQATSLQPALQQQLQEIQHLIDQGYINYPANDNAVTRLRGLLLQNPENQAVQAVVEQCADGLVGMATQAYQQANQYEARNILEEALSLYPEHAAANALWRQWVGA